VGNFRFRAAGGRQCQFSRHKAHLGPQEATSDFLPEMSCQKHVSYFMWDQTVYETGKKIAFIRGNKNQYSFQFIYFSPQTSQNRAVKSFKAILAFLLVDNCGGA